MPMIVEMPIADEPPTSPRKLRRPRSFLLLRRQNKQTAYSMGDDNEASLDALLTCEAADQAPTLTLFYGAFECRS